MMAVNPEQIKARKQVADQVPMFGDRDVEEPSKEDWSGGRHWTAALNAIQGFSRGVDKADPLYSPSARRYR